MFLIGAKPIPDQSAKPVYYDGHDRTVSADYPLSTLPIWNDGLSEMSYYRATSRIYGKKRSYTRIHMFNRQWMDPIRGVKTDLIASDSVPVFKLNISEEIPVENHNYRYMTTLFLRRSDLSAFKMATSSQEWCGTSYKHLRWQENNLSIQSFSYLNNEGENHWQLDGDAVPYESLLILARNVTATGLPISLNVLTPLRSNKQVEPIIYKATLKPGPIQQISIHAGKFQARRIDVDWNGPQTGFLVEAQKPYRLLRFRMGFTHGELLHVERRPYWDQKSKSSFYKAGKAP